MMTLHPSRGSDRLRRATRSINESLSDGAQMADRDEDKNAARIEREREFYDKIGDSRVKQPGFVPHAFHFYLSKQSEIVKTAFAPRQAGQFLEIGSTTWIDWIERSGIRPAKLTCINISERELEKGINASVHTEIKPDFRVMDAHVLEFPDQSLDVVFGGGILHHLEYERALREIKRVLKPGGIMVFNEPMDINPVGRIARRINPHYRTEDEMPFRMRELEICQSIFSTEFYFEQFTSVFAGAVSARIFPSPSNVLTRSAFRVDEALLQLFPALGPYYRYVLIVGE